MKSPTVIARRRRTMKEELCMKYMKICLVLLLSLATTGGLLAAPPPRGTFRKGGPVRRMSRPQHRRGVHHGRRWTSRPWGYHVGGRYHFCRGHDFDGCEFCGDSVRFISPPVVVARRPVVVPVADPELPVGTSGEKRDSAWYNSRHYRANVQLEEDRVVLRDVHKMCDESQMPLPGVMALDGTFHELRVKTPERNTLVVEALRTDGTCATVTFRKGAISIAGATLDWEFAGVEDFTAVGSNTAIDCIFRGSAYRIGLNGVCAQTDKGFRIVSITSAPVKLEFNR